MQHKTPETNKKTNKKSLNTFLLLAGGATSFAGALLQLGRFEVAPYVFSVGAAAIIVYQFLQHEATNHNNMRTQRLARIGLMSSLLLGLGAYLMFSNSNLWVPATLIYALVSLFLSFRTAE